MMRLGRRSMGGLGVVCLVALVLGGCGGGESEAPPDSSTTMPEPAAPPTHGTELDAARARWAAAGLASYTFVIEDDCGECDPEWAIPRRVVVWDDTVLDATGTMITVDALFAMVESAGQDGRSVEATYHPEFGYPTEIWIDREARAYDGGTHLLGHALSPGLPGSDVSVAELEAAQRRWTENRPSAYEFRTDILCDCPFEVTLWTLVDGDRIADWRVERSREDGTGNVAPSTMEQLFADLHRLVSEGEVVEGGARITGTADYDPELGYPTWIGLDVEVLDPTSELGELPPRLVFVVRDVKPHELTETEFERAVERWTRVGTSEYEYELTIHDIVDASFGPPHLVTVTGGEITSVTVDGLVVDPTTIPAYSIDELFAQIDRWGADGWTVDVIYDQRLGHPVFVTAIRGEDIVAFSIDGLLPAR